MFFSVGGSGFVNPSLAFFFAFSFSFLGRGGHGFCGYVSCCRNLVSIVFQTCPLSHCLNCMCVFTETYMQAYTCSHTHAGFEAYTAVMEVAVQAKCSFHWKFSLIFSYLK